MFTFLEGWYNQHRWHSALGYGTPVEYERRRFQEARALEKTRERMDLRAVGHGVQGGDRGQADRAGITPTLSIEAG